MFFSRGTSLADWYRSGILDREIRIYLELLKNGYKVTFITYGDKNDLLFRDKLCGINIKCNNLNLPLELYEATLTFWQWRIFKKCHLIKTNQMYGAELALRVAKKFRKPLVNRMGYLLSDAVEKLSEFQHFDLREINDMQNKVFRNAKKIVVTTNQIREKIKSKNKQLAKKLFVIPNYVDTILFSPAKVQKKYDVLFVGRISEQKNLSSLLHALKNCNLKSLIIGSGVLKEKLIQEYGTKKNVKWMDPVSNHKIPHYMNQSKLFILPSYYEGHPKILIEAMSCGMIVLASNVDGNNQIVRDNINGFLCEPNHRSIEEKINDILKMDDAKLNQIRTSARDHILNQFSIEKVVKMELDLYQNIFANKKNYH